MHTIRIATRSSVQARTQASAVATALEQAHPNVKTELVFVDTTGDKNTSDGWTRRVRERSSTSSSR
jgi:porphobilinogen deaminase